MENNEKKPWWDTPEFREKMRIYREHERKKAKVIKVLLDILGCLIGSLIGCGLMYGLGRLFGLC